MSCVVNSSTNHSHDQWAKHHAETYSDFAWKGLHGCLSAF